MKLFKKKNLSEEPIQPSNFQKSFGLQMGFWDLYSKIDKNKGVSISRDNVKKIYERVLELEKIDIRFDPMKESYDTTLKVHMKEGTLIIYGYWHMKEERSADKIVGARFYKYAEKDSYHVGPKHQKVNHTSYKKQTDEKNSGKSIQSSEEQVAVDSMNSVKAEPSDEQGLQKDSEKAEQKNQGIQAENTKRNTLGKKSEKESENKSEEKPDNSPVDKKTSEANSKKKNKSDLFRRLLDGMNGSTGLRETRRNT
ncbi:hypothetical protein BAU15_03495 [Enterococcus sp. JM4C]|uniref:hypothetical protein n=1 Tax=Candidatus Enterococcus huntleyi TaxID=1857217 RepID=UPI00137977F6|nr:hypothetical protein [Enterococcus sp. JM4C]KAF1295617.1 hypothetical protein BAU15_03495 [Enterococcus sp. JM4C]